MLRRSIYGGFASSVELLDIAEESCRRFDRLRPCVLPLRQYRTVDDLQQVTRVWHVLVLTRLRDDRLVYKDCRSSLFLDNVYINVCLRLVANLTMTTLVERKLIWFFHFFFFLFISLYFAHFYILSLTVSVVADDPGWWINRLCVVGDDTHTNTNTRHQQIRVVNAFRQGVDTRFMERTNPALAAVLQRQASASLQAKRLSQASSIDYADAPGAAGIGGDRERTGSSSTGAEQLHQHHHRDNYLAPEMDMERLSSRSHTETAV